MGVHTFKKNNEKTTQQKQHQNEGNEGSCCFWSSGGAASPRFQQLMYTTFHLPGPTINFQKIKTLVFHSFFLGGFIVAIFNDFQSAWVGEKINFNASKQPENPQLDGQVFSIKSVLVWPIDLGWSTRPTPGHVPLLRNKSLIRPY